jgi:vacuolar-type H+-ATPase subunit I/STV1
MYVFIFISLFVYLYKKGSVNLSLIPLALAIAMKFVPAVFLLLLIADKRYKEVVYVLLLASVITILSFSMFQGSIIDNLHGMADRMNSFKQIYIINNEGLAYNPSIYGAIKYSAVRIFPDTFINNPKNVSMLYTIYSVFAGLLMLVICFITVFIEKSFWKRTMLAVIAFIALPAVTGDYRLLFFFIPLYLFIIEEKKDKRDLVYSIVFSFFLIPKTYFFVQRPLMMYFYHPYCFPDHYASNISISIFLNPLVMIFCVFLIVSDGIVSRKNEKEETSNNEKSLRLYR